MNWSFIYYSSRVEQDLLALPKGLLHEFVAMKRLMEKRGPGLGMPYTKAMGDGLFEMRLKDQYGIARIFYCTITGHNIIVLHSFIKKTQKTPDRELQLAKKRLKEIKNHA